MKNRMIKMSLIVCLAVLLGGLQSCDTKMKELIDSKWTLEQITTSYGQELFPSDFYTMMISEDLLHIKLDINACKLPFTLKDKSTISIEDKAMCTRACCDSEMAKTFLEKLKGDMAFEVDNDKLILSGEDKLIFRKWSENDVKKEKTEEYLKIKRTGCFGTCPIYEMTLYNDGSASYLGKRFVEVTGNELHTFDKKRVADLMNRAKRLDFGSLQPVYDNPQISDMESVFIEYNGTVIKVRYDEDVPPELLKLIGDVHQCAIDAGWVSGK